MSQAGNTPPLTTSEDYLSSGIQWRIAHLLLIESPAFSDQYTNVILPSQEIAGFSFENFFKSLLRHYGETQNFTGRRYGHDLIGLMRLCIGHGCEFDNILVSEELVSDVGEHHGDYSLRYMSGAGRYRIRGYEEVQGALGRLEAYVRQVVFPTGQTSGQDLTP